MAYYLDSGNCNPHYLVPNCSTINLEYITSNMVKIKQLCLSIGSAKYRGGGMAPKVALSYHWITLVKTLILDYTLILLPQYINNGWDHHRQQYILHICGACCGSDAEYCSVHGNLSHSSNRSLRRSAHVLSTFRRVWTALPNWSQACSIGFKSGEQAGQSTLVICSCYRYASTILARWGRTLSSWNNAPCPMFWT